MKLARLCWVGMLASCAGREPSPAEPPAQPPELASPAPAEVPAPAPRAPRRDAGPEPVPPLSTPNPRPSADADAAPPAEDAEGVPHVDPRLTALRRAGEAAQTCYDQAGLPQGTRGKLFVRITLASDGTVKRAVVDRSRSSAALVGGKLEACVLDAVARQKFTAPRSEADVLLEMPLEFEPVQSRAR